MASFNSTIITNKGHDLMAKIVAGTAQPNFTKINVSDYQYASGTDFEALTSMTSVKQTALVSSVSKVNDATVKVSAGLNNASLATGYYLRAIGLYAIDPQEGEILYSITTAIEPDWIPPNSGVSASSIMIDLITVVSNASNVSIEVDPAAVATVGDLQSVTQTITLHSETGINTEEGVHGIRFFNDKLEFNDGVGWVEIKTGGSGIAPNNVSNFNASIGNTEITLTWDDPNDTIVDGQLLSTWEGTKIVRKAGSYPVDEADGILILDNKVRNQYSSSGFLDSGLTNGVTYYYQAFPYSDQGAVNRNEANRVSGTPQPFKIYGVTIDLANSNPETSVAYTDDAIGMVGGDSAWDTMAIFKDIKPCVVKNGIVQYYLDPTDYTKKADGTASDITSGGDGDVMIEIPKTGYLIETLGDIVTIKVTDNPNNSSFKYYAHSRDIEGDREKLYIGAYLGWYDGSSKLRSLSGKTPTATQTIGTFRTQAQANGVGYDLVSFYPLTLLQILYLIRFKNLDSQTALGRGYVDGNSAAIATGGTNAKGIYFGEATGTLQMKFLGIEDFWGNLRWWIDGLFSDATRNILTAFKDFNDTGAGYVDNGQGATADIGNYMSKPQGTTETGFIAKEVAGSETTYFCDYAYLYASRLPYFGGAWSNASYAGAFCLVVSFSDAYSSSSLGGRLMYL